MRRWLLSPSQGDSVPSIDYSQILFFDESAYHNGIAYQYDKINTLHDISYTASKACQAFISIGTMVSSNFQIQHMIFLNNVNIYKGSSCFISVYLNAGDSILLKVRTGADSDGYIMQTGVLGDGQNASAYLKVFGMKIN